MKDLAAGERLGRKFTCAPFIAHGRGLRELLIGFAMVCRDTKFVLIKIKIIRADLNLIKYPQYVWDYFLVLITVCVQGTESK